jgi:glycine C-acetyltransferase
MYSDRIQDFFQSELAGIREKGLYKRERVICSAQGSQVDTDEGEAINLCANNYLGMANHPDILDAARSALEVRGYGMASVRFICGTQDIHKELEKKIADFFGTEDTNL